MFSKFTTEILFIISSFFIILGLKSFSSLRKLRLGNTLVAVSLTLITASTFMDTKIKNYEWIFSALVLGSVFGVIVAKKIKADSFPELLVFFWLLNGSSAALLLFQIFLYHPIMKFGVYGHILYSVLAGLFITALIIAISLLLLLKLTDITADKPFHYPLKHFLNFIMFCLILFLGSFIVYKQNSDSNLLFFYFSLSLFFGMFFFSGISRLLNQIYFSLLNLLSAINLLVFGFLFENYFIMIMSALLFSVGLNLFFQIQNHLKIDWKIFFKSSSLNSKNSQPSFFQEIELGDAALLVQNSRKIFILPGLEFIVSNAQFICHQLEEVLKEYGTDVKYILHPFASKAYGHINLVLSEANIEYSNFIEIYQANLEIREIDLLLVIGANDLFNLSTLVNSTLEKYILDISQAKRILILTQTKQDLVEVLQDNSFEKRIYVLNGEPKTTLSRLIEQIQKNLE